MGKVFLAAAWLCAAWAAAQEAKPVDERVVRLPLCPMAVGRGADGRLDAVRFLYVPFGLRSACQGKTAKECRDIHWGRGIARYALRRKEPENILEVLATGKQVELMRALSAAKAVRALEDRRDSRWTAAGAPAEFFYDKRRAVTAEVRWALWADGEDLTILRVLK